MKIMDDKDKVNNTTPQGKKLRQPTLSFFTKQSSSVTVQPPESPPSKKAKVQQIQVIPDIIQLQDDDDDDDHQEEEEEEEQRDQPKVHGLSSLVGSALKRKLKRKATTKTPKKAKASSKTSNKSKKIVEKTTEETPPKDIEVKEPTPEPAESIPCTSIEIVDSDDEDIPQIAEETSTQTLREKSPTEETAPQESVDNMDCEEVTEIPSKPASPAAVESVSSKDSEMMDCDSDPTTSTDDCDKKETVEVTDQLKTPKSSKRIRTKVLLNTPTSSTTSPGGASDRKLTPKQLQKKLDSEKKKQEREKEKLEREKKRQEEKEARDKVRLEKEELKKKEKEEKEDQKRKEKEEKDKQKELEKKEREEREENKRKEKELKEELKKKEKEAKEEDRRRKEQEKEEEKKRKELEKEEMEIKHKKAAAAFVNFFVPKAGSSKEVNESSREVSKNSFLSNFRIKADMRLAPTVRRHLSEAKKTKLEDYIKQQNCNDKSYVAALKNSDYSIKTMGKTWPLSEIKDECVLVEDDLPPVDDMNVEMENSQKQVMKAKLFSFSENRRPPYWGTWRKKSKCINGRRPFSLDKDFLDYECDSDDEWEEEEPGESVGSVAGSDDEDGGDNEYDVDNEFMVPHGYLSEEEALGEDDVAMSPETQKLKLKLLEDEFENERKKTTERLHPRLLGIIWQTEESKKPDQCSDPVWNFLNKRQMLFAEYPILIQPPSENAEEANEGTNEVKSEVKKKRSNKILEEMMPNLIKLVHGNTNNKGFLCKEFSTFVSSNVSKCVDGKENDNPPTPIRVLSKLTIVKKIKDISHWIACPDQGAMQGKMCWYVNKEVRDKYELQDLALPNTWKYSLQPRKAVRTLVIAPTPDPAQQEKEEKTTFQITKFTKVLSKEEREKQFTAAPEPAEKKRVNLLVSGPRGVALPSSGDVNETKEEHAVKGARSNLLSQFIKIGDKRKREELDSDDCVVLSD